MADTATTVSTLAAQSLDQPDETRTPPKAQIQVNNLAGHSIGRFVFEPGWQWSQSVKPTAGTEQCEKNHVGYCVSGALEVWTTDGERVTIRPGDAYTIPPGHDARTIGDEAFVGIEFASADTFAKS
jgi:quercetin dioxygenase-like cupin family protein